MTLISSLRPLILPALILVSACSTSSQSSTDESRPQNLDPIAYDLGCAQASSLLSRSLSVNDLRDSLLEINARATHLRTNAGDNAADSYIYGFESTIRQSGDTLAATLL